MIERGKRVAEYSFRLTEFLQKMDSHLLVDARKTKTYSVRTNTLTKHAIPNHRKKLGIDQGIQKLRTECLGIEPYFQIKAHKDHTCKMEAC